MENTIQPSIPWVEKYRPSKFQDIVLDPLNRQLFQNSLDKNYFPNMLFYGPPGTGKTTTVINLINEYQTRYNRINKSTVIHLNASDERGIDIIRNQIHQFVRSLNLFETGLKFVILDEVDYMTKNAQQALKYILQTSTYNVRFCLICNYITKIEEALKNEFICIRFNQLPQTEIFQFMQHIAYAEHLTLSDDFLANIQDMYHSDIRSMINYIQLNQHLLHTNEKQPIKFKDSPLFLTSIVLDELLNVMENNVETEVKELKPMDSNVFPSLITKVNELSIQYNMDKRTIIQKLLTHVLRNYPSKIKSQSLKNLELFLHRQDIPIDVYLQYWCDTKIF